MANVHIGSVFSAFTRSPLGPPRFTAMGQVAAKMSWETGRGAYWPCGIEVKANLPSFPYRFALWESSDHENDGSGVRFSNDLETWIEPADSSLSASITNPVIETKETPWCVWNPVQERFDLYVHGGVTGGQATYLYHSTDFLTWTEHGVVLPLTGPLDHTGYLRGRWIGDRLVAHSQLIGGTQSVAGIWESTNGEDLVLDPRYIFTGHAGVLDTTPAETALSSWRRMTINQSDWFGVGSRRWAILPEKDVGSSGTATGSPQLRICQLDDQRTCGITDGYRRLVRPMEAWPNGDAQDDWETYREMPTIITPTTAGKYQGRTCVLYRGISSDETTGAIGLAVMDGTP